MRECREDYGRLPNCSGHVRTCDASGYAVARLAEGDRMGRAPGGQSVRRNLRCLGGLSRSSEAYFGLLRDARDRRSDSAARSRARLARRMIRR